MKNVMKKATACLMALILVIALVPAVPAAAVDASSVGSLWDGFTSGSDTFTVSESSRLFVVSSSAPTGDLLQTAQLIQRELQAQFSGCFTELVWGPESYAWAGDIVLKLDTSSGTGADGYKLDVTATTATVTAEDTDGLIYGANNLIKCFRAVGSNSISGFSGYDTPDTAERTVSLDCGRKYLSAEWIKNFIRQMSWMGYNTLQLHFSDDGGFRIDLWDPEYFTSKNGNDFSWLAGSATQTWVYNGNKNNSSYDYKTDPDKNKHLTAAELVEICNVAKEYHIDIIPSFDSPSHMDYITWRYEYQANHEGITFYQNGETYTADYYNNYCINYTGKTAYSLGADETAGPTNWPCYTTIDITDGTYAKAFVFALYEDIADFFKQYAGSTKFSIGADEVNLTTSSEYYPRKWSASAFPGYINDLNELLNNKGYTMRMYNDFMGSSSFSLSDFDSNIEIQYWDSPFKPNSGGKGTGKAASSFVSDGRTLYNCIQTHTYYVLRVANSSGAATQYTDARNPANRQWTFYHSTEDLIYNEWVPNNVSEKGDYSESVADIPSNNLGGAYFLIWNDYPTVSTEAQLWNGAPDTTGTNNGVSYYLLDRMASNIIKQWNWDINKTVTYTKFAEVRAKFGNFPGYTSCSEDASLPAAAAPAQAYLTDHTALKAALAAVITEQDSYTDESWTAYQAAVTAAREVDANYAATADQVAEALSDLNTAKDGLKIKTSTDETVETNFVVTYKTETVSDEVKIIKEQYLYLSPTAASFQIYLPVIPGYSFAYAEGCTFVPLASNDGSGYLRGTGTGGITVWLNNEPDAARLEELVAAAPDVQGDYTYDSWTAYQSALNAAKDFTVANSTTQADIDALVNALLDAQTALVTAAGETKILDIENLAGLNADGDFVARLGKQVGLRITTTADVESITVDGETLTVHSGRVQQVGGETVKVWLICFPADEEGTFAYNIHAGNATETITIKIT